MIKKLLLGLTFVTAFTFMSAGVTENAQAWRRWYVGRPYVTYYPRRAYYYGGYVPYRSYYRGPIYGAPRYYRQPYPYYYDGPAYYYGPRSGVSVSVGF